MVARLIALIQACFKLIMSQSKKVIVGMSGGVDSSVAAWLLQQEGYEVEGLFMKNWNEDDGTEYCTAATDLMDAAAVCQKLDIHLHTVNFAADYWNNVFEHFLTEYQAGRTPNPDILCNREIKFKVFLEHAAKLGAHYIATGHYCRNRINNGEGQLLKGKDQNKDQSYFLHAIESSAIAKTLFPIGNLDKAEVRKLAENQGLVTHDKKDSTGICFIGERRFKDFLENYLPAQPGEIIDDKGNFLGKHDGLMYHTIGQRQGLGIGGIKGASEAPWYVADKDLVNNRLIVVQGSEHPRLYKKKLKASQCHWINEKPSPNTPLKAKIRYRQSDQDCIIESDVKDCIEVLFHQPQRAITPGQSIVFYEGERCLGGAVIDGALTDTDSAVIDFAT